MEGSPYRVLTGVVIFIVVISLFVAWNMRAPAPAPEKPPPAPLLTEAMLAKLTPLQRAVTQNRAEEKEFENEYWNNQREGIYVDVISGAALFSSADKFDSGKGWPCFTRPVNSAAVTHKNDTSSAVPRREVRSVSANSHLGYVYNDGPAEKGGQRYCLKSAALRFVPKEDLVKEKLEEYVSGFEAPSVPPPLAEPTAPPVDEPVPAPAIEPPPLEKDLPEQP